MNIVALLSWYDEDPAWLSDMIASLTKIPVDRLIAVDGAYALYPDGTHRSGSGQYKAIIHGCRHHGIDLTIHTPATVWAGNEVEKRNHVFHLAEQATDPDDWYLVIDADERVLQAPDDIPDRLAASPFDVGAVTLREPGHPLGTIVYPTHPKFFRAIRGLRCVKDHFTYTTPDGRKLWGNAKTDRLEPRQNVTEVIVEHRNQLRHPDRRQAALTYYDTRDAAGIEDIPATRSLLAETA